MFQYSISGLSVASDIRLPGAIERDAADGIADVGIARGTVPAVLDGSTDAGPNWSIAGDRFLFEVPGIVRMLLVAGRTLTYATAPGVTPDDPAIFLGATGFGILLQQRGVIVLHASAVRVGDAAILFCGPSGAGKSTLAAALGKAGYGMLADDICGVDLRDDRGWVAPDGRRHRLWRNAIREFTLDDRTAAPVRGGIEKFLVEPRSLADAAMPIAAIYQLREERPPHAAGIDRPNLIDASLIVRRNAYRPNLVRAMGQQALYFQGSAVLARHAGIHRLTRPMRFDAIPDTIRQLEAQWRKSGLLEAAA